MQPDPDIEPGFDFIVDPDTDPEYGNSPDMTPEEAARNELRQKMDEYTDDTEILFVTSEYDPSDPGKRIREAEELLKNPDHEDHNRPVVAVIPNSRPDESDILELAQL